MSNISLELDEIYNLAKNTFLNSGCDDETATIMADLVTKAEKEDPYRMVYSECQLT